MRPLASEAVRAVRPFRGLLVSLFLPWLFLVGDLEGAERLSFLVIDGDSYLAQQALQRLDLPPSIQVRVFTHEDLKSSAEARKFIASSRTVVVDVMMNELAEYLVDHRLVTGRRVYALRGSRDDEGLKKKGFIFDPEIKAYFENLSRANLVNLLRRVAALSIDPGIRYEPVVKQPQLGIYHPRAPGIFPSAAEYRKWVQSRPEYRPDAPWVGLMFFSASLIEGQVEALNRVIQRIEEAGFNVLPCFGKDGEVLTQLLREPSGRSAVDLVVSFSLKFYSAIDDRVKKALQDLGVPVLSAINLYTSAIDTWKGDPVGIPPLDVVWSVANPEISGAIEPTVLTGKKEAGRPGAGGRVYVVQAIEAQLNRLIPRLKKWADLRHKPNAAKRIAVMYYNHSPGKQNIGAAYLNVFRSLEAILDRLKREGYAVPEDRGLTEAAIQDQIQKTGRNIGSWAPGELDRMLNQGALVRVPLTTYEQWFDRLPPEFKKPVLKQWGPPRSSSIMVKNGEIIIPAVRLGNLVLLPEPARGWSDDPLKLYHDLDFQPHHQYIAAYLWLKHGFQADAVIHLGTHATHEWLPGKQAGLSAACPPEVLLTDLPNVYPYIVDDVGEGLQAKRRGRAVIIDHLTPPLRRSDLYREYLELQGLIEQFENSLSLAAQTTPVYREQIQGLVRRLGLDRELGLKEVDDAGIDQVHHYLQEIRTSLLPFGLHTFGRSPGAEALEETAGAVASKNPGVDPGEIREGLRRSGPREMAHLVEALKGGYVPPGEGNDPIRNPAALPTGKNFFGFSPDRIPTPAAWRLGQQAGEEIIRRHRAEQGRYPEKTAVVLWAVETLRNEGINESTILHLLGLEPVWDRGGRVTGTRVIPGPALNRPRIDVLINPSGLYRDLFPDKLLWLDRAVQQAMAQTDIENFLLKNNRRIKTGLKQSGLAEEQAESLSRMRIFTEAPGSYGNRVSEMTGASGNWKSDAEISAVFEQQTGFAYGQGQWGLPARSALKENLKEVDTALHSMSSSVFGTMDNDDMFASLGGLVMAIRSNSGRAPETVVTRSPQSDKLQVEGLSRVIDRELRIRYRNPKWIAGMKAEDYAGAREMSNFVEYFWGWQVTVPNAVRADQWRETFEVYVEDKYGQGLKEFFDRRNPWAYQSLAARMLEAVRKAYWKADEKTTRKLAAEYAVNVVQKGVACCDHTCNNPLLNQMVVSIISLPGVLSPEIVEQFKLAVEQAAGRKLKDQVQAHRQLQQTLQAGFNREREASRRTEAEPEARREEPGEKSPGADERVVEGYRMKEMKTAADRTEVSTSGVQWFASLFILFVIALFMVGARTGGVKAVSWFGVLLAGLLANALPAAAQHHAGHGAEKPVVMDAVTVTAERMEEYIKNHPQQVISMGREEILKRNLLSVEEALNTMPGVDVRRSAGIGSRISIRGSGKSGGVLVLFNGRPLNTSQYGGVDLEAIPVDLVESITVFMPPVPVWLGPGAVDGAISITTREFLPAVRSPKPAPTRLRLLAGSYGLAEGSLSQTWLTGRDNLLLSATGTHRDGKRPNSDRNSGSVALQWNRQDEAADQSELLGRYYGAEYGAPGPLDNPTPEARQRYRQGAFDAGRKGLLGESGEYALNAYGDLTALRDQSQTGFVSDLVDLKLGLKGQTVWSQAEGLWALRVNGLLEREEADYTLYGDHLRMLAGLSVNGDRNFGPATVTLGVRGDQTNDFGFNPGINGGVGVPLPAQCLLKANAGYLVKLPTFGQLYQTSHGSIDQVRGNPNLDKERIRSFELGLEHRPKKDRLVQLNLFRTETDEPIVYLRGPDLIYRPINADWSVRQGVDFSLKYAWEQGLALDAGIILQTSELQPGGKELPYTPGRKLKAALKYALPSWLTRLEAILRYEGEQFSEAENRPDQKLGDYFVVDVKAIQPFSAGGLEVEGFLHIENLFNRAYEIHYGYPDDGIRFIAGFNLKF